MPAAARLPVTAIIPAFNAAATIGRAIASIRNQVQPPSEIIVIDDGSSDGTADVARHYGVRVIEQLNAGPSSARNAGILAAAHEWIAFLDADDAWVPDKLAEQWSALRACPGATLVFAGEIRHRDGKTDERPLTIFPGYQATRVQRVAAGLTRPEMASFTEHFIRAPYINLCSVLVQRASVLEAGLFDVSLRLSEDFELWLRLFRRGGVACIERPLVDHYYHDGSISCDDNALRLSLAAVWERVRAAPARYPDGTPEFMERRVAVVLREAVRISVLRGEANRAREAAAILGRIDRSPKARVLAVCATLAGSKTGRRWYRCLRNAWRSSRGKAPLTYS